MSQNPALKVGGNVLEKYFTFSVVSALLIFGLSNVWVGYQIYPWLHRWRARRSLAASSEELEEPETITRIFSHATVVFKINSTACKWFHVGLLDSRSVKVVEYSPTDVAQPEPRDYPNQSYFGISQGENVPELEMSVKAVFEVYAGDNITIFTRKSDDGTLKLRVFDTGGVLRGELQTSRTSEPENFDECGIAFHMDSI